ncbi:MAG: kelch repeat-containing protein [Bacteroidota bacterium]
MQTNIFLIVVLLGIAACKQVKKKPSSEFVRNAHSMVYHQKEASVYLFGGASEKEVLNDLWVLKDSSWSYVKAENGPAPRTFASMVYDKKNERIILFGGSRVLFGKEVSSENLLNDTWELKNDRWKKIDTRKSPIARAEAETVFHNERGSIILFGGYVIDGGKYLKLGDTWEFSENEWRPVSSEGPSPRHGVSMGYDFLNQHIVLFGGSTEDKQYGESEGQTWVFKNDHWSMINTVQPSGVYNASMAYHKKTNEFIRFGGWNGDRRINETWSYKKENWNKLPVQNSPNPRNHSRMIYDEKRDRILLFGGHNGTEVFGDLWEFRDYKWNKIINGKPKTRVENHH